MNSQHINTALSVTDQAGIALIEQRISRLSQVHGLSDRIITSVLTRRIVDLPHSTHLCLLPDELLPYFWIDYWFTIYRILTIPDRVYQCELMIWHRCCTISPNPHKWH